MIQSRERVSGTRVGTVQEYHYHLGAVNTITFIEEGKMFVSTSDDKTLRVWELGISVQARAPLPPPLFSILIELPEQSVAFRGSHILL